MNHLLACLNHRSPDPISAREQPAAYCYDVILNLYITSNHDIRCDEDILSQVIFKPILCASSRSRNRHAFQENQQMCDCKDPAVLRATSLTDGA
jgi:hypothetical protein